MKRFSEWLAHKWGRKQEADLAEAYRATFQTFHGQRVLNHLLDNVYCSIYEGKDAIEGATHNGRRSVIHEILEVLDQAEHPEKFQVRTETEEQ